MKLEDSMDGLRFIASLDQQRQERDNPTTKALRQILNVLTMYHDKNGRGKHEGR